MKRLNAAKLERLGRLVCGPLWQSELARTMGVSRQTVLRWAAGEFEASFEYTAKAKALVRARIGELQRFSKSCEGGASGGDRPSPITPPPLGAFGGTDAVAVAHHSKTLDAYRAGTRWSLHWHDHRMVVVHGNSVLITRPAQGAGLCNQLQRKPC